MDVSKNRGIPKWMVKIMENPINMIDLGVFPYFWVNTHIIAISVVNTSRISLDLSSCVDRSPNLCSNRLINVETMEDTHLYPLVN